MSEIEKKLAEIQNSLEKEQFERGLLQVEELETKVGTSSSYQMKCQLLKSTLANKLGAYEKGLESARKAYAGQTERHYSLDVLESLVLMVEALWHIGGYKEGLEIVKEAESIIPFLKKEYNRAVTRKEGFLMSHKAVCYLFLGDLDNALKYHLECLSIRRELNIKTDIGVSLNNIGEVYRTRGELNKALECYFEYLDLCKEIPGDRELREALPNLNIGHVYREKGELDLALEHLEKSLRCYRKIKAQVHIGETLCSMGTIYKLKGQLDQAHKYMEEALKANREGLHPLGIAENLFRLVTISVDRNSLQTAKTYSQQLQTLNKECQNKVIDQTYRLTRAICLKASEHTSDSLNFDVIFRSLCKYVASRKMLKRIIEEDIISHDLTVEAIFNLCELLLVELKTFGSKESLQEVNRLAQRLLQIGEKENLFSLVAKTQFLIAKLSLLNFDVPRAQHLLAKAHHIAYEKGYDRLALVISREERKLMDTLPSWLVNEETPFFERLEKVQLERLVVSLKENRVESYTGEMLGKPTMGDLELFTNQLRKRKFEW